MEKWIGKIAVVTGASAGIGTAIVKDLANAGVNVVALARRVDRLKTLETELVNSPGKVTAIACDVSSKESVETAFKKIEDLFGVIHILINNAGVIRSLDISDKGDDLKAMEQFEEVIQTNFTGLVHCTRKALNLIEKSDDYGIIINIGSVAGQIVVNLDFKMNVYPGTKHAVRATTEVLRFELVRKNNRRIRVAEIRPGGVATEIAAVGGFAENFEAFKELGFPMLSPFDVSQAVTFLLTTPYTVNITELVIKPTGETV